MEGRIQGTGLAGVYRVEAIRHFLRLVLGKVLGEGGSEQLAPGDTKPLGQGIGGGEQLVGKGDGGLHTTV